MGSTATSSCRLRPPRMALPTPLTDSRRRTTPVCDVGHLPDRLAGRAQGDEEHGRGVGLDLGHHGRVDAPGQLGQHGVHLLLHFLAGDIDVLLQGLNCTMTWLRDALDENAAQLLDAADGIDCAFQPVGDFPLHVLWRGARLDGRYHHRWAGQSSGNWSTPICR